jgi:protein TonB
VAFDQVKTPPRFPGGDMEMYRFINRTRNYSEQMKNDGITGSVNINFTVEKDGRITDINVTKSSNSVLEEDAMRIVKSMPKWTPAENDGTPVRTTRTVVIKYE